MGYLSEMADQGYDASAIGLFHRVMIPYLVRCLAGASTVELVIDIGAGQGHGLVPLWEQGYRNLVAVDIENDNFEVFENRYGIRCYQCDVERESIPLEDNSAAVSLALHVIEHLDHPGHFLGEVKRLLRPGGHAFLVTPDWRKQIKTFWRDPTHRHPYDRIAMARLLRIHGFTDVWTSPWNSRYGFGRLRAYRFFPRLGMIGKDLLAHGMKSL